jgi:hypothetical protein
MSPTEAWLRGPIEGVPSLLMPAAHALAHAREDATSALVDLEPGQIWMDVGAASVGFHVRHLAGALDRLLTYARGESLSEAAKRAMQAEGDPGDPPADAATLIGEVSAAVERALAQLRSTSTDSLLEPRGVGRKQLPSTVVGLLFHAAEHAARHAGQAMTTARIVRSVRDGR